MCFAAISYDNQHIFFEVKGVNKVVRGVRRRTGTPLGSSKSMTSPASIPTSTDLGSGKVTGAASAFDQWGPFRVSDLYFFHGIATDRPAVFHWDEL